MRSMDGLLSRAELEPASQPQSVEAGAPGAQGQPWPRQQLDAAAPCIVLHVGTEAGHSDLQQKPYQAPGSARALRSQERPVAWRPGHPGTGGSSSS